MNNKIDIESQWLLLNTWIEEYISSPRKEKLIALYESRAETICTAPASSHTERHRCIPGGYIDHVNRVVSVALKLYDVWGKLGANQSNFTKEELVFAALNHDLGKIGSTSGDYYLENDSKWHYEKGQHYKLNGDLQFMKVPDRSLFILQEYGISVTENEFLAIKLHDGLYGKGNESYYMATSYDFGLKTDLPILLHHADHLATLIEGNLEHNKSSVASPKTTITPPAKVMNKPVVESNLSKFKDIFDDV